MVIRLLGTLAGVAGAAAAALGDANNPGAVANSGSPPCDAGWPANNEIRDATVLLVSTGEEGEKRDVLLGASGAGWSGIAAWIAAKSIGRSVGLDKGKSPAI